MTEEIIKGCEFYLPLSEKCNEILDDNGNEIYKCSKRQDCHYKKLKRLEQENKELKEWKERVVRLFESACRCKYLNEEKDICSYTNEKCININKCVYKYQELSDIYRSALEEIRNYCVRIEQGSVIGTLDCLINSIKNITNEVLNPS